MQVKTNIRQRQLDRIRQLKQTIDSTQGQEQPSPGGTSLYPLGRKSQRAENASRSENVMPRETQRLNTMDRYRMDTEDPEEAWRREENERWKEWMTPPSKTQIRRKLVLCLVLFVMIWGVFQIRHPLAIKAQHFIARSLTENADFGAVKHWYASHIGGSPSFIPAFVSHKKTDRPAQAAIKSYTVPFAGRITAPYSATSNGIRLEASAAQASVKSIASGRVIYAGRKTDDSFTVIVQHADKVQSVYGHLSAVDVKDNDWLQNGQTIGSVKGEDGKAVLLFGIARDGRYLDPAEVIHFD